MNVQGQIDAIARHFPYQEGPNNQNLFTSWQTNGQWHGAQWCDSTAQYGACVGGGFVWPEYCQFRTKGDAYVPYTEEHARRMGIWEDKGVRARPGWQYLLDFNGNGVADHIGTFVRWDDDGEHFWGWEGNYHDRLALVKRDGTFRLGWVRFDDTGPQPAPTQPPTSVPTIVSTLSETGGDEVSYKEAIISVPTDNHGRGGTVCATEQEASGGLWRPGVTITWNGVRAWGIHGANPLSTNGRYPPAGREMSIDNYGGFLSIEVVSPTPAAPVDVVVRYVD